MAPRGEREFAEAMFVKANVMYEQGSYEAALGCYQQILADDPSNVRALHALGVIAFKRHDIVAAVFFLIRALELQPDFATAWCSLGKIKRNLGLNWAARLSYLKAISFGEAEVEALYSLGAVCGELNLYAESLSYLQFALEKAPENPQVHYELGNLYLGSKNYDAALDCFDRALSLKHDFLEVYEKKSDVYYAQGKITDAISALQQCLKLRPDTTSAHRLLAFVLNYEPGVEPEQIYKISCEWARLSKKALIKGESNPRDNLFTEDRPLRIGFVSPDFRRHPVGYFVQSFLLLHDSDNFEVYCYSDVRFEDEITQILIDSAEKWRRIYGVRDETLAAMVRRDGIDILVDLAGHTRDNRLNVFLLKPAPIQVTWAGYVGTTGLDAIDYLISDRYQSPEDAEGYTVEQIVRLPDDYVCFMPPEHAPDVAPAPVLQNGYVTFGSFNNLAKLSNEAISLWCEVLHRLPESRMFIKNPSFGDLDTVQRYLTVFESYGIGRNRIQAEGPGTPEELLECYAKVDIQLDSMPYSGGLTTLESLWMGVPVITLPGRLFSSRHSLTHLMNIGLPEFVAISRDDYVEIACSLASNVARLVEVRRTLRDKMISSPVCDGFSFVENLQEAFKEMWRKLCASHEVVDLSYMSKVDIEVSCGNWGDHIGYNEQGNLYSVQGDFDLAIKCYLEAINIKPEYSEAYYNLGLAYLQCNQEQNAYLMLRLAVCFAPDLVEACEMLEDIMGAGRIDEAKAVGELLEKYLARFSVPSEQRQLRTL